MASSLSKVIGDYYGIDPETMKVERVTRTAYGTLVFHGREFKPQQLGEGRTAQFAIEELFGLRDVIFVPTAMQGTVLEEMTIEELKHLAASPPL
jgi:hypothetical protein